MLILFCSAMPEGQPGLDIHSEIRKALDRLAEHSAATGLDLRYSPAVTVEHLSRDLRAHGPAVLHFAGHGARGDGGDRRDAIFILDAGRPRELDAATLGTILRIAGRSVRLVVLNACHSRPLAQAAARISGLAIGMSTAIADAAAIRFSAAFYGALASRRPVSQAFEAGCEAARLAGERCSVARNFAVSDDEDVVPPNPVLFARADVDPAQTFLCD